MLFSAQVTLPFTVLPIVLASAFLMIWALIAWLKFLEHLQAAREHETHSHIVSVRKVGPRRAHVDHGAG